MKDADYRVKLYPDGKYRWIYEVNLLRNPTVLFDVYKVLGMSIVILVVIALLIGLFSGDLSLSLLKGLGVGLLAATGVMLVLGALGYVFYALITGKKYIVLFTLDEHELVHKQMPATMKKARLIGELAILAGAVAGRPGVAGAGMLAASRDSLTSTLSDVKQVVPPPMDEHHQGERDVVQKPRLRLRRGLWFRAPVPSRTLSEFEEVRSEK